MTPPPPSQIAPEHLKQHRLWLESKQLRGERLVLDGEHPDVDLHDQDLRKARISGNLRGANLRGADLSEADLNDVSLWDADLTDANLTGAKGLRSTKARGGIHPLSGANLCGAKLPDDVAKFGALDNVAELSKNAGALFLSLISGDALIQLIVAKATDLQLLTNSGSTTIPFINADIPITALFWLAPLLLLINFIALHLYLQRLWELMSSLPAVFPDGLLLTQKSYPWLVNDIVRSEFPQLAKREQVYAKYQKWLFTFLIYAAVPISLFSIWAKYLKVHFWPVTWWHNVATALFVWFTLSFYAIAKATLAREQDHLTMWRSRVTFRNIIGKISLVAPRVLIAIVFLAFSYMLSLNAISWGIPREYWHAERPELGQYALRRWVPRVLEEIGYSPFANLREIEVSAKPDKWMDNAKDEVDSVRGRAKLSGQDLRYADLTGAFVVHGDFRHTILTHAHMTGADLRSANCKDSDITGADLSNCKLENAILTSALFRRADLELADLKGAHMVGAHLEGAHLDWAHLEAANLRGAHLEGADLVGADLGGADLRGAHLLGAHLGVAHLDRAHLEAANLRGAHLEGAHLEGAHLESADLELADLGGAHLEGADLVLADLGGADLGGADLGGAHLEAANLRGAHLKGADLEGAHLGGAHLEAADLEWADLGGAHLEAADLERAHLEGAHLKGADLEWAVYSKDTVFPEHFNPKRDKMVLR